MSWNDSNDLLLDHSIPSIKEDGDEAENNLIDAIEKRERGVVLTRSASLNKDGDVSSTGTPPSPFIPASKRVNASVLYNIAMRRKHGKHQKQKAASMTEKDTFSPNFSPKPLKGKALFKNVAMRVQEDIHNKGDFSYGAIEGNEGRMPEQRNKPPRRKTFANLSAGFFPIQPTQTDHLFNRAEQVAMLFEESSESSDEEHLPDYHSDISHTQSLKDVESATTPFIERVKEQKRRKKRGCCARLWKCFRNQYFAVQEVLNPKFVFIATCQFLFFKVILIMVPCVVLAYFLYYHLDNPELQFLPGSASISWWLIFIVRQMITLQIANIIEHTLCDIIALRSTLSVKLLGPLVTLALCNAEGWPFIVTCWGLTDLILLHGNQPFIRNWLFFLDIDLLNNNPDNGLLASEFYLRILISVVIVGVTTIGKRTYLALYFGKRMFLHYRFRLEKILAKVAILSQLALLADITEDEATTNSIHFEPASLAHFSGPTRLGTEGEKDDMDSLSATGSVEMENAKIASAVSKTSVKVEEPSNVSSHNLSDKTIKELKQKRKMRRNRGSQSESMAAEEHWKEPVSKTNNYNQPLIKDILHFRKALWYLKGPHPFTDSFGPADTRDQFLHSAELLYVRLQRFLSDDASEALPFEVLSAIAYNDDGLMDKEKERILRKLFRADSNDEVSLDPFVQSCDSVYKQLRFFLAAVENASQIDAVLERVANGVFFFLLALVLMTLMNFDPWSLLLSVSSLLVSFSFAVGPSVSTYVSGVLLIAVRRPYDIGDRIVVRSPTSDDCFKPAITWLVEDVNLSYTTLRFNSTNEVATVNNGSLALLRIHNGNREPNALVTIPLFFRIGTTHEEVELFFVAVKKFIRDNSLIWNDIVFFRTETADTAMGYIQYNLRVEHSKTHQAAPQIMINKGVLIRFCIEEMLKRDIYYISSRKQVNLYIKENEAEMDSVLRNPVQIEQQGDKMQKKPVTMSDVLQSSGLKVVD